MSDPKEEKDKDYWQKWGNSKYYQKDYQGSIECYGKALEINTNCADTWYGLGIANKAINNYQETIRCFEKALEIKPNYFSSYSEWDKKVDTELLMIRIGSISNKNWSLEKDIDHYKKVLKIIPFHIDTLLNVANIYIEQKDYIEAQHYYEKILEIDKSSHEAWYHLGFISENQKNYRKAQHCYENALEIDKNSHEAWYHLGITYENQKKYQDAQNCYERALEIDENSHEAWYHLGITFENQKNYQEAQSCYKKTSKIYYGYEDVENKLIILDKIIEKDPQNLDKPDISKKKQKTKISIPRKKIIKKEIKVNKKLLNESAKFIDQKLSQSQNKFTNSQIQIKRGGDWKVEGNQSVFHFKVKINNNSDYIITGIHILLTSIPSALRVFSDHHLIKILKPHSYESPTFKFAAKESCVGDYIKGLITYFNYLDKEHTIMIEPYKIEYVCNLLVAKLISKQEFDHKTKNMKKKKLIIESNLDISELESTITSIIRKCNFALIQDLQTIRNKEFKNFEGYAQGLYDKQDVALSVAIKKIDEGSKLVVKAMSDRSEKVTDILKDFNTKLDDIKSNTQLIIEYTEQIDQILDEMDNLEEYLKEHLASDFEKIKYIWKDYSLGKIERKELIGKCIKILGKKFIGLVISNLNF